MSVFNYRHDTEFSERGLLGGVANGILGGGDATATDNNPLGGLPTLSLPPLPSISLPGLGGQSTSSSSSTITLTSSSAATSSAATTSQPSSTAQSTSSSAASTTTSSSSLVSSTSTSLTSTSPTSSATQTSSSTTPATGASTGGLSRTATTTTATSSSSASVSAAALPATAPKGFLENKGLSVGVITAASLVGLVLFIALATWAIRRRRRSKLHDEAVDFTPFPSSDELLSSGHDVEKANDKGNGIPGSGRRASGGSASGENGQSGPSTYGSSSGHAASSTGPSREMYERTGYPALPVFVPAPPLMSTSQTAYSAQSYTAPNQAYNDGGPYPYYNRSAYQANAPLLPRANNYEDSYQPRGLAPRPSQRKPIPPLLPLDISATRSDISPPAYPGTTAAPSPISAISLNVDPMQPASAVNPANPRLSPIDQGAAQSKRSSLLNSPARLAYSSDGGSPSAVRSHSQRLEPIAQQPPFMESLPDQFGAVEPPPKDEKAAIRQLTVRNE